MVHSSRVITTLAKPLAGQPSKTGPGIVLRRVDDSTYIISLNREPVTVKVTEGTLTPGQQVTVAERNDQLVITPARVPSSDTDAADADTFTRRSLPDGRGASQSVRVAVESIIAALSSEGLRQEDAKQCELLFKTMEGRLSAIDKSLTGAAAAALRSLAARPSAETAAVAPTAREALVILEQLRDKIPAAPANPAAARSATLQSPVPDGLQRFTSVDEALSVLKPATASMEPFTRELEAALARDGAITVRTAAYDRQNTVATIMTADEISRELEALPARFTSRAFQSIPAAVFQQLLENRGKLDLDQLRVLDGFANQMRLPAASQRAGSRGAQEAALLQWLSAVHDARAPTASLSSLLPSFSASSIIDSLEELAIGASKLPGAPLALPDAEDFSITRKTVSESTDRAKLLESVMRRLGFTLENSLAKNEPPQERSFKLQLLETSRSLQTDAPASAAAQLPSAKAVDELIAAVRARLGVLFTAQPGSAEQGAANRLRQDIDAVLQKGSDDLKAHLERLTVEADKPERSLPEKPGPSARTVTSPSPADVEQHIDTRVQELSREIETVLKKEVERLSASEVREPGDAAKKIAALSDEILKNAGGVDRIKAAELAKLLERVFREIPDLVQNRAVPDEKPDATHRKTVAMVAGDAGKRIENLLVVLSRSSSAPVRKNAAELTKAIETVVSAATDDRKGAVIAHSSRATPPAPVKSSQDHAVPLKIIAAVRTVIDAFAGDAGKRIDTLMADLARSPRVQEQKAAAELAKIIETVSNQAREVVLTKTPPPTPEAMQKSAEAAQKVIETFSGESGRRINDLVAGLSKNAQPSTQKATAELAKIIETVSNQVKEVVQTKTASPSPETAQKSAETVQKVIETFSGESGRRINELIADLSKNAQPSTQKATAELAKIIETISNQVKEVVQTKKAFPSPETVQKSAEAVQKVIETFSGESGRRINDLVADLSKNAQPSTQKAAAELAKIIETVSNQAKEVVLTKTPPPTPEAVQKSAEAVQKVIETFSGESGRRINELIADLSKNAQPSTQKATAELAKIIETVSNQVKEVVQTKTASPSPETAQKSAETVQKVIETFSGESGRRINDLIADLSKNTPPATQKAAVELAKIIETVSNQAKEVVLTKTPPPTPEAVQKSAEAVQKVIETFSGESGRRITDLLADLSKNTQPSTQKAAAELAKIIETVSNQAKEVVQTKTTSPSPETVQKTAGVFQTIIDTFSGDALQRIETLVRELSQSSRPETQKTAIQLAALLKAVGDSTTELITAKLSAPTLAILRAFSEAAEGRSSVRQQEPIQSRNVSLSGAPAFLNPPGEETDLQTSTLARELPAKLSALLEHVVRTFAVSAEQRFETAQGTRFLPADTATLQKAAADFSALMERLAVKAAEPGDSKAAPVSRQAVASFMNDAANRFEIMLKNLVLENEGPVTKTSIAFTRFVGRLIDEAEIFSSVLSAKAASPKIAGGTAELLFQSAGRGELSLKTADLVQRDLSARVPDLLRSSVDSFAAEAGKRAEEMFETLLRDSGQSLRKSADMLAGLMKGLAGEAESLIRTRIAGTLSPGVPAVTSDAMETGNVASDRTVPRPAETPSGPPPDLARLSRELPEKMAASLRSAFAALINDAEKQLTARMQELSDRMDPAAASARTADQTVTAKAADTRAAAMLAALHDALEKDLPALFRRSGDLKPIVNHIADSVLREQPQDRSGAQSVAAKQETAPLPADDQSLLRQAVRQNVDTLLNRFESLQVLARQVQNLEGEQQQILAVPIKVGTEWTEMNVRFVHKRRKTSDAADGHFTVYLNVAPALLGAIGATLEYTKDKDLNIALHFEHHATRQWFAAKKNELSETIGALGLPVPRITLFMERKVKPAPTVSTPTGPASAGASNTLLDVRA